MGLTYPEAERLGLAHEHPDHPSRRGQAVPPVEIPGNVVPAGKRPRIARVNDKGQNKTEAAFDDYLADLERSGVIQHYAFEPITLRLAAKTRLTLDFAVSFPKLHLIDVKGGPWEDDAAVKMKVAVDKFSWLAGFWVVRRGPRGKGWEFRRVTRLSGLEPVTNGHPFKP